jgi:low affinity Fe/Cu permease
VSERGRNTMFDRFAESAADVTGHAMFFGACVVLIVVWIPSYIFIRNLDTWQLIINTATTIVTFLLVALLQNSQRRSDQAMHAKLDALADGLADLMAHAGGDAGALDDDIRELRQAVGLEHPTSPA